MHAEEVAMFLTSTPHLLNRTEKWAWRRAGIRPLRRRALVSGINKTAEGRKHTLAVWRDVIWMRMGCTWGSAPIDPFTSPHTSDITPTVFAKHLLGASFVFDFQWPPHLHQLDWPVSLPLLEDYLKGCGVADLYRFLPEPLSLLCASTCFAAQLAESQRRRQQQQIVPQKCVSHIRGTDNSQNLQSVKAHHKFSSERLWHCQAELEKIKTSILETPNRKRETETGTGRLTHLPHIHLSVFMGAQAVSVTALPHLGDSEKGVVISAVEGTAWWSWISYDNMMTVIELVIIAQSLSLSPGSERQLLALYTPSLQGCDVGIIHLQ